MTTEMWQLLAWIVGMAMLLVTVPVLSVMRAETRAIRNAIRKEMERLRRDEAEYLRTDIEWRDE